MRKFKIGDRVRVTPLWAEDCPENQHQVGWEGTVVDSEFTTSIWPIRVQMDNQIETFPWHMTEEELEHVV